MAGEMFQDEVTRENYPLHFAIADKFHGKVIAFDQYQGPYVVIGKDVRVGNSPYAIAPRGMVIVRLWLCSDDGGAYFIYNEANERKSEEFLLLREGGPISNEQQAVWAAEEVLA